MATKPALKRELGLRDLTLFAITCVTSARWIPIAAHAGPGSVTLWLLAGVLFMAPLAVAVAALVAKYPEAGGLYLWTRRDFGPWPGFLCFWVYWMGIAFLFPTAALLYVKVGFSMFGPSFARLGDNRFYLLAATAALIWIALGSNLIGLKVGKWTENIGALATWAAGLLLVAVAWVVWTRRGSATPIHILPKWNWGTVNFWAAIAYATSGMEGPGMMAGEIRNPERTMRRAGWIASAFALAFYVSATVAFLVVLSPENISELNGFAEFGDSAGLLLGAAWLSPLIALLVVASGVGFVGGLGTATSRLPFAAGVDHLLPAAFGKVHPRWGTPYAAILALGLVATLLLVVYQLGDTMRVAYDELVSMMVIAGFLPYLYIFGSAWKTGKRLSAVSGGAMTGLALFCSVVPPAEITNVWLFEGKLAAGTLAVVASAWLVYHRRIQS
ncbi:MAG TPA: APC family permease [Candidatus Acidoferrales bacterium]|nr:APC family permease [Candidatus Acidoferrales bacterium]